MGGSRGMLSRIRGEAAPAPGPAPGASYQAPAATIYTPYSSPLVGGKGPAAPISPYQAPQPLAPSPLVQQIMAQQAQPVRGLNDLMMMLRPGVQRPAPQMMPMPVYRAPALNYRPNMAPAQQSLGRVAVSVAEQQRRAAQAELDRLKAENEALQQRSGYDSGYSGGG